MRNICAGELDGSVCWLQQTHRGAADSGFAATRLAHEPKCAPFPNGEADTVDGVNMPCRALEHTGLDGEVLLEVFNLQHRLIA